jgi:hypothetical protein
MLKSMLFPFLVALAILYSGQSYAYSNWGQAFSVWPDTGQATCYGGGITGEVLEPCPGEGQPFHGQDAQYSGPARSYTKLDLNGNDLPESAASWAMVRDNVTGLIWEAKQQADGAKDYSNPSDADNTYDWCSSDPADGDYGSCAGNDTEDFLALLNNGSGFAGHTDWRLPTIKELLTLIDWGRVNPAVSTTYFPQVALADYWSATTDLYGGAWSVNFQTGRDGILSKFDSYYVRAVRGGQVQPEDRFVDNQNGTVTDTVTCLQWQQATAGSMNWEGALAYAENLSLAGYTDWRLPNINELTSIVDYSRIDPAVDPAAFPGTVSSSYWTSTTSLALMTYYAWAVNFSSGFNYYDIDKNGNISVRAVRGKGCGHFPWNLFLPAITNESQP